MLTKNQKCNISVFLMFAASILIFNFAWLIIAEKADILSCKPSLVEIILKPEKKDWIWVLSSNKISPSDLRAKSMSSQRFGQKVIGVRGRHRHGRKVSRRGRLQHRHRLGFTGDQRRPGQIKTGHFVTSMTFRNPRLLRQINNCRHTIKIKVKHKTLVVQKFQKINFRIEIFSRS